MKRDHHEKGPSVGPSVQQALPGLASQALSLSLLVGKVAFTPTPHRAPCGFLTLILDGEKPAFHYPSTFTSATQKLLQRLTDFKSTM